MAERIEKAKVDLADSRKRLDEVLDQVGDRWETPVYSEEAAWNVQQLLVHLSISHQGLVNQVIGAAEGREVVPPDFDLERYNRRSVEKRADQTVAESRASLVASYQQLLDWLATVDDEAVLDKMGRHATLKMMSAEELLYEIVHHERLHADDIARVLAIN